MKILVSSFCVVTLIDHAQNKISWRWRYNHNKKLYEKKTICIGTLKIVRADDIAKWTSKSNELVCYFQPFYLWKKIMNIIGIYAYGLCLWNKADIEKAVIFKL